jgi:CHAT domain-containing protein
MIKVGPRHVLVFLLVFVLTPAAVPRAQSEDVLSRENDDQAATIEQRQQALAKCLAAANGLRDTEPSRAAAFLNRAGQLQIRLNVSREALTTFRDALTLLKLTPESPVYIDALNGMASAYDDLSKCDDAQDLANQAIPLSEHSGYVAGKAKALLTLSDCQGYSDPALALQTAQAALEQWRSIGNKTGIARSYSLMSDFQIAQHKLDGATTSNEAALQIWRELNIPAEQAGALINLGFIEYRKGAMQDSLSLLTQAQTLLDEKAEPFKMGQITTGMGQAFVESGMPEAGLVKLKQAIEYYRLAGNPRAVVDISWDIGKAQFLLGNYSEALSSLQQTIRDAESIREPTTIAMCHDFLGRTYAALDDSATALSHLEMAMNLYTQGSKRREAARVLALIGRLKQKEAKDEEARINYRGALETFRALSDHVNESATLYALGTLELKEGHLDLAENYLRQSIDVTENMRRVSTSRDLTTAFSATVHDRYETYIECLMRMHYANPAGHLDVRAFETSELARGRSLAELLRNTQTNFFPGLDHQLAEREKSLRQSLRVKEDDRVRLLGTTYKKEELDALETELSRLESDYQQVTATIRKQYPAYDQVTKPVAWTLPQIQKQVVADDQTLLLEFSLGAQRSYIWAVSRTEISSYELPGRAEIENEVRRFYDLLTTSQPKPGITFDQQQERVRQAEAELPTLTASLSELLLGPVADKLGTKRLLIVADGPLQYIPFQALSLPVKNDLSDSSAKASSNETRLLISDHEIINEPSASILALVLSESANRVPPSNSVAVLADPVFESDDPRIAAAAKPGTQPATSQGQETQFHQALRDVNLSGDGHIPRLLASRAEANAIMAVTPWLSGFEATGFDASRATVTKTNLSDYRIVHFATHGLLNNEHPELSGIVLSLFDQKGQPQDGYLRLDDIYNLKLPVDLVVLSACNTGLGKDVRGEGLIGLTRGFMYAGASSVVASLWKVDDEATSELMRLFYGYMLRDGLSPAAALRKAQVTMSQQKRWQSPYYWAGFVIQGQFLPNERVNRFSSQRLVLGLIAAAVLGGAAFYVWRRRRKISL